MILKIYLARKGKKLNQQKNKTKSNKVQSNLLGILNKIRINKHTIKIRIYGVAVINTKKTTMKLLTIILTRNLSQEITLTIRKLKNSLNKI